MASLQCGLTHGREDGPPGGEGHRGFETVKPARTREASSYLDESGAARLALVRLFSRMDAGVRLEIGRPVKLGAADVAVVRLRTWSLRSGSSVFRIQIHEVHVGVL